jgi:hypothetical protein
MNHTLTLGDHYQFRMAGLQSEIYGELTDHLYDMDGRPIQFRIPRPDDTFITINANNVLYWWKP